jgi:hypothetical protein
MTHGCQFYKTCEKGEDCPDAWTPAQRSAHIGKLVELHYTKPDCYKKIKKGEKDNG